MRLELICAEAPKRYEDRLRGSPRGRCLIADARAELARIRLAVEELKIPVGDEHHERCRRMFAELSFPGKQIATCTNAST